MLQIEREDGGRADVEVHGAHTQYLSRYLLIFRDVTKRMRVEQALRQSEQRLSTALEIGRMGAYSVNLRDEGVWWSPEMFDLVGVDRDTFVPSRASFQKLVHPDDWEGLIAHRQATINGHEALLHEFRIVRPDGAVRWISNRAQTAYFENGSPDRHYGVALDITERRRDEEVLREHARLLREADERKNEFLAMLAHELRGPLAPIRNAAFLLEMTKGADPGVARAGAMIDRHVKHLSRLVDDLLDMARVSTGKVRLRRERIDLVPVMLQGLEMSQPLIDSKQHALTVKLPEQPVMVDGDATRLAQVICNLLDNAAKYTDARGSIVLSLDVEERRFGAAAVMRVLDNGRGIAAEALTSLFELFYQADRNLDRAEGGLGIGLSLVRDLVRMHDGEIEASSKGLGLGSTLTVILPLAAAAPDSVDAAVAANDPREMTGRARVLIVDDNLDAADSLAILIGMDGHLTRTAHDGASAVEIAMKWRPTLILLDLGMPGMDGVEVCEALRAQGLVECTIVAVTGYGEPASRERTRQAGFNDHLVKPIDTGMLGPYLA
jgi:PAS domain S-box-containing protein